MSTDVNTKHTGGMDADNVSSTDALCLKLNVKCRQLLCVSVSAALAGCIANTAKKSERFLQGFIQYSQHHGQRMKGCDLYIESDKRAARPCVKQQSVIAVIVNIIYGAPMRPDLDYKW